ncbi:hypothetical protein PVAG01_05805 [Phlyctema vagabunda]|uniref:Uncharacterized protein n=1 Tax=Phlyctema vagabunda TaxID=108571 RepID=A0ABR4PEE2_9HELO
MADPDLGRGEEFPASMRPSPATQQLPDPPMQVARPISTPETTAEDNLESMLAVIIDFCSFPFENIWSWRDATFHIINNLIAITSNFARPIHLLFVEHLTESITPFISVAPLAYDVLFIFLSLVALPTWWSEDLVLELAFGRLTYVFEFVRSVWQLGSYDDECYTALMLGEGVEWTVMKGCEGYRDGVFWRRWDSVLAVSMACLAGLFALVYYIGFRYRGIRAAERFEWIVFLIWRVSRVVIETIAGLFGFFVGLVTLDFFWLRLPRTILKECWWYPREFWQFWGNQRNYSIEYQRNANAKGHRTNAGETPPDNGNTCTGGEDSKAVPQRVAFGTRISRWFERREESRMQRIYREMEAERDQLAVFRNQCIRFHFPHTNHPKNIQTTAADPKWFAEALRTAEANADLYRRQRDEARTEREDFRGEWQKAEIALTGMRAGIKVDLTPNHLLNELRRKDAVIASMARDASLRKQQDQLSARRYNSDWRQALQQDRDASIQHTQPTPQPVQESGSFGQGQGQGQTQGLPQPVAYPAGSFEQAQPQLQAQVFQTGTFGQNRPQPQPEPQTQTQAQKQAEEDSRRRRRDIIALDEEDLRLQKANWDFFTRSGENGPSIDSHAKGQLSKIRQSWGEMMHRVGRALGVDVSFYQIEESIPWVERYILIGAAHDNSQPIQSLATSDLENDNHRLQGQLTDLQRQLEDLQAEHNEMLKQGRALMLSKDRGIGDSQQRIANLERRINELSGQLNDCHSTTYNLRQQLVDQSTGMNVPNAPEPTAAHQNPSKSTGVSPKQANGLFNFGAIISQLTGASDANVRDNKSDFGATTSHSSIDPRPLKRRLDDSGSIIPIAAPEPAESDIVAARMRFATSIGVKTNASYSTTRNPTELRTAVNHSVADNAFSRSSNTFQAGASNTSTVSNAFAGTIRRPQIGVHGVDTTDNAFAGKSSTALQSRASGVTGAYNTIAGRFNAPQAEPSNIDTPVSNQGTTWSSYWSKALAPPEPEPIVQPPTPTAWSDYWTNRQPQPQQESSRSTANSGWNSGQRSTTRANGFRPAAVESDDDLDEDGEGVNITSQSLLSPNMDYELENELENKLENEIESMEIEDFADFDDSIHTHNILSNQPPLRGRGNTFPGQQGQGRGRGRSRGEDSPRGRGKRVTWADQQSPNGRGQWDNNPPNQQNQRMQQQPRGRGNNRNNTAPQGRQGNGNAPAPDKNDIQIQRQEKRIAALQNVLEGAGQRFKRWRPGTKDYDPILAMGSRREHILNLEGLAQYHGINLPSWAETNKS